MQLDLDAEQLLGSLLDEGVQFVVIGGLAVVFHGYVRVTEDVDVCYRRTHDNCAAVAKALAPFHPRLRGAPQGLPFVLDAATLRAGLNFTLETNLGPIDLLGEVTGAGGYDEIVLSSVAVCLGRHTLHVMGLDALMNAKRGAGRIKDLLDIEALDKLRHG